jgi:virginiamycin B lyase
MRNCSSRTWTALVGLLVALIPSVALVRGAGAVVVDEFPVPPATLPAGIVRGPDGNLWFTEFDGSRIDRITPGGVVTEFTPPPNRGPLGITVGSDNLLYFTERLADRIGRLDPLAASDALIQASLVEFAVSGVGSAPHGITTGPDGAV